MPLYKIVLSYLLTTVVFFAVDMTWLGFIAKDLYKKYLGSFLSDKVNWPAAIIFYLLLKRLLYQKQLLLVPYLDFLPTLLMILPTWLL